MAEGNPTSCFRCTSTNVGRDPFLDDLVCMDCGVTEEARNTSFCPSQEKLHTVVVRGV
jgi:hypothetical protein